MKLKILAFAILLSATTTNTSCNNDNKNTPSQMEYKEVATDSLLPPTSDNVATTNTDTPSEQTDCDRFLNEYESYSLEYINAAKRLGSDPTNESNLLEFNRHTQKIQQWSERWTNLATDCANDASFSQKYLNITNRITEAAKQMY